MGLRCWAPGKRKARRGTHRWLVLRSGWTDSNPTHPLTTDEWRIVQCTGEQRHSAFCRNESAFRRFKPDDFRYAPCNARVGPRGILNPMTDDSPEGWSVPPVPNPPLLPPATNGYRRSLYPGRGVSVYCDRHPPNEWPEHRHVHDQISGLLDAVECFVRIKCPDGKWTDFHVQGPTVWVIPGGTPHGLIYPKEADMFTLYAEQGFVRETLQGQRTKFKTVPLSLLTSRDEMIGQLSKAFCRLCREREKANPLYVESIGTVLATHIFRAMFATSQREDPVGGLPDGALRRVVRHIDENLAGELCLFVLANAAGYRSTSYFGKLFRRSFGLTPHDYLMRRRVARAEELLETTQLKAVEIAHMCGFSDDTMMARWFRRVSDRLPSDIRP